jgi:hypothetical protein
MRGCSLSNVDALEIAKKLRHKVTVTALRELHSHDPALRKVCRQLWAGAPEAGGLVSAPWVEAAFPAKHSSETFDDLISSGDISGEFFAQIKRCGVFPTNRPLFTHQLAAIQSAKAARDRENKPALVVTAGTGAGKTESFLFPLLDLLFSIKQEENEGVSAIILYPMNALVADQVNRVSAWLKGQSKVTVFHFTSETPDKESDAEGRGLPKNSWQFRSRETAREGKNGKFPTILVTNYSMLEYMLCRPQDNVFFGPALRSVVLDETHLYSGTLAAEVALLLRRVYERCRVDSSKIFNFATTATIGDGVVDFAAKLFSKSIDDIHFIQGETADYVPPQAEQPEVVLTAKDVVLRGAEIPDTLDFGADGTITLARDLKRTEAAAMAASGFVAESRIKHALQDSNNQPACLLHSALSYSPLAQKLNSILRRTRWLPLSALATELWSADTISSQADKETATTLLLQLCARGRIEPNAYPLLPHRLHLMVRPPAGLSLCRNPECTGPFSHRWGDRGLVIADAVAQCPHCDSATSALGHCSNCGSPIVLPSAIIDSKSSCQCAQCGSTNASATPFTLAAPVLLAVTSETLLAALPPWPDAGQTFRPSRGRRLLAFSDSRREAARLGPVLTRSHEIQMVRAILLNEIEQVSDTSSIELTQRIEEDLARYRDEFGRQTNAILKDRVKRKIENCEQELAVARSGLALNDWLKSIADNNKSALEFFDLVNSENHATVDGVWTQPSWENNFEPSKKRFVGLAYVEVVLATKRGSPESMGTIQVCYPGIERAKIPTLFTISLLGEVSAKLSEVWPVLLACLLDGVRANGCVVLPKDCESLGELRVDYAGKRCTKRSEAMGGWSEKFVTGKTSAQFEFAENILVEAGLTRDDAANTATSLLDAAFESLIALSADLGGQSFLKVVDDATTDNTNEKMFQILAERLAVKKPAAVFWARKNRAVFVRSVFGCFPRPGVSDLEEYPSIANLPDAGFTKERVEELRDSPEYKSGLWAEEHSAQLSPIETRRLQDLLKLGARNILSATTTLELGIDIGGLNAVFMANVPPGKANYLQRAGRAGRRADGSSLVVTCARTQPFDRAVFSNFGKFLDQKMRMPTVIFERERVIRRHAHAWLMGEMYRFRRNHSSTMGAFGQMATFMGVNPDPEYWSTNTTKPKLHNAVCSVSADSGLWFGDDRAAPPPKSIFEGFLQMLRFLRGPAGLAARDRLKSVVRNTMLSETIENSWNDFLEQVASSFLAATQTWTEDYNDLYKRWDASNDRETCNAIRRQLHILARAYVIEILAERQFLPRYGFPIGLMKLRVNNQSDNNQSGGRTVWASEGKFRLERPGILALREYAPGAALIAGGQVLRSRGLTRWWVDANRDEQAVGLAGSATLCENKHFFKLSGDITDPSKAICPICEKGARCPPYRIIEPRFGFTTAAWEKPSRVIRYEESTEVVTDAFSYLAKGASASLLPVPGLHGVSAVHQEDGEITAYTLGTVEQGYLLCWNCGFSCEGDPATSKANSLTDEFRRHKQLDKPGDKKTCIEKCPPASYATRVAIGSRQITDILYLTIDIPTFGNDPKQMTVALHTVAQALQVAGARLLELDTREIGKSVGQLEAESQAIVLFDNVPGGAGHTHELLVRANEWFSLARDLLYLNETHNKRCATACLDCILTFDAQRLAASGMLDRRLGLQVLDAVLGR